jgi:nucleotide-binding universal stress UspA family protein
MTYKRVLVPVDGSRTSGLGLREAIGLARAQKASLQLVHVVDAHYVVMTMETAVSVDEVLPALRRQGRRILQKAQAMTQRQGVKCSALLLETLMEPAADLIVRQAKKGRADLIVMGTHGRRGVSRLVMGSDAEQVVRNSPVPVLLVRSKS